MPVPRERALLILVTMLASLALVAIAVEIRLGDTQRNGIVPAEDPYNHMALVREHLRDGRIGPLYAGGDLYPPGMHAFLATVWVYTGADLYQIFLLAPVFFGALGVAGMALFLGRLEGPVAAIVGGLGYAIAPEIVFRTTMMAPTAVDLALLPFLFLSLLETMRGYRAWALPAIVLTLFLVFAHPWILAVVAAAGFLVLLLSIALPWTHERGLGIDPWGVAMVTLIVGGGLTLSLSGCAGACGPGAANVTTGGDRFNGLSPFIAGLSALPMAILLARRDGLDWIRPPRPARIAATPPRITASALLLIALVAITIPAYREGLPQFVDPSRMIGLPLLALAFLAIIALPFLPSPAMHAGTALLLVTYPFVLYNPLHSDYWPHRTAVFLGAACVILAACVSAAIARAVQAAGTRQAAPGSAARATRAALPALLVLVALAGTVYAATPGPYPDGWYRLYTPCQNQALDGVATVANADPTLTVITGSWQAKLVVAAQTDNASRIWLKTDFFTNEQERRGVLEDARFDHRDIVAVVDPELGNQTNHADLSFFHSSPWKPILQECGENGRPTLIAYSSGANP